MTTLAKQTSKLFLICWVIALPGTVIEASREDRLSIYTIFEAAGFGLAAWVIGLAALIGFRSHPVKAWKVSVIVSLVVIFLATLGNLSGR